MDRYNPERVHKRVGYIQYIYREMPENFETFTYPLAVYDRDGIIIGANKIFRELAAIKSDDVLSGTVNFFECLDDKNSGLAETARNTFDGDERAYAGTDRLLRAKPESAAYCLLVRFPNAIFFPIARDRNSVKLAGVLLDENK